MVEQVRAALEILRRRQVEQRTGMPRESIYRAIAMGKFPSPIKLGKRASGWIASEIDGWIADRIAESRSKPASSTRKPKNSAASAPPAR